MSLFQTPETMGREVSGCSAKMVPDPMRAAFFIWVILLMGLCLAPVPLKHHLRTNGRLHDVGHILAFFITSILLLWRARRWQIRSAWMLVGLCLACATEFSEMAMYHNRFEWDDVRRDGIGLIFGFLFTTLRMDAEHSPIRSLDPQVKASDGTVSRG